ncbi:MAG: sterol desaturase family protein [Myxococcota bacterium]|nr:sterol desaturase family protein [Myxococcota bacterium]
MTTARTALARLGFPLLLSITIAGALSTMDSGTKPSVAIAPWVLVAYVFLAVAERLFPLHERWLRRHDDVATDIGLFVTNAIVNGLGAPLVLVAGASAAAALSGWIGSDLWPAAAPIGVQLALALIVAEAVEYGAHRAMHEVPWLWRFHATHHSAARLYWFNSVRFHPIDAFVVGAVKLVPLAFLGAGEAVLALVTLFAAVHGAYQHANVPVRLGPLNWIFSMSELHRWHHSPVPEESNHNYGGNLILWDVVFGTRWLPSDREPPEAIGIESMPGFPTGFLDQLRVPFRWSRVVEESAGGAGPAESPGA